MSKDIVFVSNNQDKVEEVKTMLKPIGFNVLSLKDLKIDLDVIEDGDTYAENALIKARALKDKYPRVIADDSGLEILALDNQPGIYSARFLGKDKSYYEKNQLVIEMLRDKENKQARFVSVIAYINQGKELTFRGEVNGVIIDEILGSHGFGYDPIFLPNGYELTFGQMQDAQKNSISHRYHALSKLKEWLKNEEK